MVNRVNILVAVLFVVSLIMTGCESTQETNLERNKALGRRMNEEIWNEGNLEMLNEIFSVDFVQHFLPDGSEMQGLIQLRDHIRDLRKAFPDWTEEIRLIVAEGDLAAIQFKSTGTNNGNFLDTPLPGNRFT